MIKLHYGTCDNCGEKHILVVHYKYEFQVKGEDYRLCEECLWKGMEVVKDD